MHKWLEVSTHTRRGHWGSHCGGTCAAGRGWSGYCCSPHFLEVHCTAQGIFHLRDKTVGCAEGARAKSKFPASTEMIISAVILERVSGGLVV